MSQTEGNDGEASSVGGDSSFDVASVLSESEYLIQAVSLMSGGGMPSQTTERRVVLASC